MPATAQRAMAVTKEGHTHALTYLVTDLHVCAQPALSRGEIEAQEGQAAPCMNLLALPHLG